ncbi:hypothetical protein QTH97_36645 [Variovorax sp. J22R24]|uniref:hypothetical protein n=1 Tax=Variovorax gracilis TaxID=3053502 RepID=UPI002575A52F|nr:hypothetical protein [Variovorax sp. J22R24]MDM0110456.1 hypothetical protein [Variovorax sp. J22R24]
MLLPLERQALDAWRSEAIDDRKLDDAYRHCGGNPLLLRAALLSDGRGASVLRRWAQLRLLQLSAPARLLLEAAAVLAEPFEIALLPALLTQTEPGYAQLEELLQFHWLVEFDNGGRYEFAHDLLREAVTEEIAPVRHRQLHAHLGEQLQQMAEPIPWAQIAHHAESATLWKRAIEACQQAGAQSEQLFSMRSAVAHYTHALSIADAHPTACTQEARIELLERRGIACSLSSDADAAVADLELAIHGTTASIDPARRQRLLVALGMVHQRADRYDVGSDSLRGATALRTARRSDRAGSCDD